MLQRTQQPTPAPAVSQHVTLLTQMSLPMNLNTASWWCFKRWSFDEYRVCLIRYAPENTKRYFHIILNILGQFLPDPTVKPGENLVKRKSRWLWPGSPRSVLHMLAWPSADTWRSLGTSQVTGSTKLLVQTNRSPLLLGLFHQVGVPIFSSVS